MTEKVIVSQRIGKMKAARVIIKNHKGHHSPGGSHSSRADMVLVGGIKGKGKELTRIEYWPWSPKSVEAAKDHLFAAADRQGYEIVPSVFDTLAEWQ